MNALISPPATPKRRILNSPSKKSLKTSSSSSELSEYNHQDKENYSDNTVISPNETRRKKGDKQQNSSKESTADAILLQYVTLQNKFQISNEDHIATIKEYEQKLSELKNENMRLKAELDQSKEELSKRDNTISEMSKEIEVMKSDVFLLKEENRDHQLKEEQMGEEYETLELNHLIVTKKKDIEINELKIEIMELEEDVEQKVLEIERLKGNLVEVTDNDELDSLANELNEVMEKVRAMKISKFRSNMDGMKQSTLCECCKTEERNIVINPCGHFKICENCLGPNELKDCPSCGSKIESTSKVLL